MTTRKHESELDTFYQFGGDILPLYIGGRYHSNFILGPKNDFATPSETVEVFNMTEGRRLFYCKPDGMVAVIDGSHPIDVKHDLALNAEELQRLYDTVGRFNAYGGVLIRVRNKGRNYTFPEGCRPAFKTIDRERLPEPPSAPISYNGMNFDYYIYIDEKELSAAVHGVYVPQIGFTVSRYYTELKNQYLTMRGLGTTNNQSATGWYFVLDTDDRSYKRLWYKMGEHFEDVISIGAGNASETIKVFRYCGTSQPILVAKIDVDVAIKEGFKFTYGGLEWSAPFFVDKQSAMEWQSKQDAAKNVEIDKAKAEAKRYQDAACKAEQAAIKADQAAMKAEQRANKAEQARTEAKDSFWTRIVTFLLAIVPAVIKLVSMYFSSKK
jgi:hypothetical protein